MKSLFKVYPDKESDILWIVFKKSASEYYKELVPGVNVEFGEKDNIIGVEILNYSKFLTGKQFRTENSKVLYEPEDDILNIDLLKGKPEDSDHINNIIISFNEKNQPLEIEILDASKMFKDVENIKSKNRIKESSASVPISIAHRIK